MPQIKKEIPPSQPEKSKDESQPPQEPQTPTSSLDDATQKKLEQQASTPQNMPGGLARAIGETLQPAEETPPSTKQLHERIMKDHAALLTKVAGEYSPDSPEWLEVSERLITEDAIRHPDAYEISGQKVASYGEWAPTFFNGLHELTHLLHPKILMLGAQTPIAAVDVNRLTAPFHPESITLTDISPVALNLAATEASNIATIRADWNDSDSTQVLPDFDIALGNRIVDMLPIPNDRSPQQTARRNARELAQILGNLAPHMSKDGGMLITLNMPSMPETKLYKYQLYALQHALVAHGLAFAQCQQVIEFEERPSPEDMGKLETYTAKDAEGNSLNMVNYPQGVLLIVKRLEKVLAEAQEAHS